MAVASPRGGALLRRPGKSRRDPVRPRVRQVPTLPPARPDRRGRGVEGSHGRRPGPEVAAPCVPPQGRNGRAWSLGGAAPGRTLRGFGGHERSRAQRRAAARDLSSGLRPPGPRPRFFTITTRGTAVPAARVGRRATRPAPALPVFVTPPLHSGAHGTDPLVRRLRRGDGVRPVRLRRPPRGLRRARLRAVRGRPGARHAAGRVAGCSPRPFPRGAPDRLASRAGARGHLLGRPDREQAHVVEGRRAEVGEDRVAEVVEPLPGQRRAEGP